MSRGYIVIAQNNNEFDYLEMTYALALSLKPHSARTQFVYA